MRDLGGKLRYAVWQFRHSPIFAAAAILTLALGIGGTTATFSPIHAVMLQSPPVSDPAELYRIGEGDAIASKQSRGPGRRLQASSAPGVPLCLPVQDILNDIA